MLDLTHRLLNVWEGSLSYASNTTFKEKSVSVFFLECMKFKLLSVFIYMLSFILHHTYIIIL